jgi:ribosomal protein L34E
MPFLNCPDCRLTVYSTKKRAPTGPCPRCGAELGGPPRRLFNTVPLSHVRQQARRLGGADTASHRTRPPMRPARR